MEVTPYGAPGLIVAAHVTEGLRLVIAYVPVPSRHTKDHHAINRDQEELFNGGIVTHALDVQVTLLQSTLLRRIPM